MDEIGISVDGVYSVCMQVAGPLIAQELSWPNLLQHV